MNGFFRASVMLLTPHHRAVLRMVYRFRRISRRGIHEQTGMRPNTVGTVVGELLEGQLLRVGGRGEPGRGRPRLRLEIDPVSRHVVGLALRREGVEAGRVNLLGRPIGPTIRRSTRDVHDSLAAGATLLREMLTPEALGVGFTSPGFIDARRHELLLSPMTPSGRVLRLHPIYASAGDVPVALENDTVALAARWALLHRAEGAGRGDVLIVRWEDGRLGATWLVNGRPAFCDLAGANELGHMQFPVHAPPCFCGGTGCLERIASTAFLRQHETESEPLPERVAAYRGKDTVLDPMLDLLALGVANAINFARIGRLVIASSLMRFPVLMAALGERIRRHTLHQLERRLQIEHWDDHEAHPVHTAASPLLAHLYTTRWASLTTVRGVEQTASDVPPARTLAAPV